MIFGAFGIGWKRKQSYTAKSYIHDGLAAMFDGIENCGYGKHVSDLKEISPIIGNIISVSDIVEVTKDSLYVGNVYSSNYPNICIGLNNSINDIQSTVEIGLTLTGTGNNTRNNICLMEYPENSSEKWRSNFMLANGYIGVSNYAVSNGERTLNPRLELPIGKFSRITLIRNGIGAYKVYGYVNDAFCRDGGYFGNNGIMRDALQFLFNYIKGHLHYIRIYNHALSTEEIETNSAIDKARFNITYGGGV